MSVYSRAFRISTLLLFFLLSNVPRLLAQATNASISGLITDRSGALVNDAAITATNIDNGTRRTSKSRSGGSYQFAGLLPGSYRLRVDKYGFKTTEIKGIRLSVGQDLVQDIRLDLGSVDQTVSVSGNGETNTVNGAVATVIGHEFIENMPLNGKDLQTLYELSPGTVVNAGGNPSGGGGFSVDGQRPTANYTTIDGASANAYVPLGSLYNVTGATTAVSASGGTNGILPIDAIEEYRMDTSTYTAENGRTPGGQIQVRTRSGTNQFHGTLFENLRNQIFDATDWFVKYNKIRQSQLRMNDFGGTFGGPLWRDRLFFFVAHDTLLLNQPNTVSRQDVPGQAIIQNANPAFKPFLAAFPSGNGGADPSNSGFDFFSGSYPFQVRDHVTSIRLDAQLPHGVHGFFRANLAPSSSASTSIVSQEGQVNVSTYTGGFSIPLTGRFVEEFTLNKTINSTRNEYHPGKVGDNNPDALRSNLPNGVDSSMEQFQFYLLTPGVYSTVGPGNLNGLSLWNAVDTITWQRGRHQVKAGGDILLRQSTINQGAAKYNLYTAFESKPPYTSLQTGTLSPYRYIQNLAQPVIDIHNVSVFVNDSWRATPSLTASIGLRWEYNPAPTVGPLGVLGLQGTSLDPTTIQASVTNKALYETHYDNLAPRFGFAWSVPGRSPGNLILRGGLGIYFDTGQAATAAEAGSSLYPYQTTVSLTNVSYQSIDFTGGTPTPVKLPQTSVYLVDSRLLSPRTYEWSLTLDQAVGVYSHLAISYVGNDGEKLAGQKSYLNSVNSHGQYAVNPAIVSPNGFLYVLVNRSHSNYQALQSQLKSQVSRQINVIASYTWAHAEDNGSTDFNSAGGGIGSLPLSNSAFDIRHILGAAVHYSPTWATANRLTRAFTNGWEIDSIVRLQTALPLTVTSSNNNQNLFLSNAEVVPGKTAVLHQRLDGNGNLIPGGVLLNHDAFTAPPKDASGNPIRQGNSATNGYRLFGLAQWDVAFSRSWKILDATVLSFRVDAFNLVNAANFASPSLVWTATNASTFGRATNTYASSNGSTPATFGQSGTQLNVFQNGGPRDLQLGLKLKF